VFRKLQISSYEYIKYLIAISMLYSMNEFAGIIKTNFIHAQIMQLVRQNVAIKIRHNPYSFSLCLLSTLRSLPDLFPYFPISGPFR